MININSKHYKLRVIIEMQMELTRTQQSNPAKQSNTLYGRKYAEALIRSLGQKKVSS
jgi:hypothetical protein